MKGLIAAIRFLTITPLPGSYGAEEESLAHSVFWFPVIGLLIGGLAAGAIYLITPVLPMPLLAMLVVIVLLAASGGLHMDGIADCADGFFSSRPRAKILTIMKDSRIGAMGVIAIFFVLGLKVAALISIPTNHLWQPVFLAPIAGRCAIVLMMGLLPYARPEGGLGSFFYTRSARIQAVWALAFLSATSFLISGTTGLIIAATIIIFIATFGLYCRYKIGGATGDTLGAACELAEAIIFFTYAILSGIFIE